jgi:hypothetical protein
MSLSCIMVTRQQHIVTCSSSATNKCGFRIWLLDFI